MYPQLTQEYQQQQQPMSTMQMEEGVSLKDHKDWLALFQHLDEDNDGLIPFAHLKNRVEAAGENSGLSNEQRTRLLQDADKNRDKMIDFGEFCALMAKAKQMHMRHVMFRAAQTVVPRSQRQEKMTYLQQYTCCPPPVLMILFSLIEIAIYIYYVVEMDAGISISGPVPIHSPLIYDPCTREQVWRLLTYALIHIGIYHILFNVLTQLLLGIPLELVHQWRVAVVYILGVIAGSLAVSVTDPRVYLAGASGGVYALIAAHIANLVVNWAEMEFAICRLVLFVILVGTDVGVALYNRYGDPAAAAGSKVSYVAHLGGFVAGLLMGIVVLRNFKLHTWERVVWWIALVGYILLLVLCVAWNIFYDGYPTETDSLCRH